jgi:hypothetical protein
LEEIEAVRQVPEELCRQIDEEKNRKSPNFRRLCLSKHPLRLLLATKKANISQFFEDLDNEQEDRLASET